MQKYLPSTTRERILDLMKEQHMTQKDLAERIGCARSTLGRFLNGETDKIGDENIIRIADVFRVSSDFLLGLTDMPDRKNYDISELGLSVQAARNLYTGKVNAKIVSKLLENPDFAEMTSRLSLYLDDRIAEGFAAQNRLYSAAAKLLQGTEAMQDIRSLQMPPYQADAAAIQTLFMKDVKALKTEAGSDLGQAKEKAETATKAILNELDKNRDIPLKKIEPGQLADAVAQSVEHLPGVDADRVKSLFLSLMGDQNGNGSPV